MAKSARTAAALAAQQGHGLPPPPVTAGGAYMAVCAQAGALFARIRGAVAVQAAPATLKSAFLEPLGGELSAELATQMCGRADADFMQLFTGELGWSLMRGGACGWRAAGC